MVLAGLFPLMRRILDRDIALDLPITIVWDSDISGSACTMVSPSVTISITVMKKEDNDHWCRITTRSDWSSHVRRTDGMILLSNTSTFMWVSTINIYAYSFIPHSYPYPLMLISKRLKECMNEWISEWVADDKSLTNPDRLGLYSSLEFGWLLAVVQVIYRRHCPQSCELEE